MLSRYLLQRYRAMWRQPKHSPDGVRLPVRINGSPSLFPQSKGPIVPQVTKLREDRCLLCTEWAAGTRLEVAFISLSLRFMQNQWSHKSGMLVIEGSIPLPASEWVQDSARFLYIPSRVSTYSENNSTSITFSFVLNPGIIFGLQFQEPRWTGNNSRRLQSFDSRRLLVQRMRKVGTDEVWACDAILVNNSRK
ncbi:hypothetical protein B0H17DRAFT_1139454 [Mycena rosella]|uniref:Uncharacterized protein n=1 Tax=Mycena rosella TaxID=1033263 RepID=A0AAD7G8K7_MYCRO|nr:hypothetical protein B0H17DRAFT_1139454 [Mycena rosella]